MLRNLCYIIVLTWTYGIVMTRWLRYSNNNCIRIVTGYSVGKYMLYYRANMNLWHSNYIIIGIITNNYITIVMGSATMILLSHRAAMSPKQGHMPTITFRNCNCPTPPLWWVVLVHICCIDIVSHTTLYHTFPDSLMSDLSHKISPMDISKLYRIQATIP